jgi:hypothetical protein
MNILFDYNLEEDMNNHKVIAFFDLSKNTKPINDLYQRKYGNKITDENLKKFITWFIKKYNIELQLTISNFDKKWQVINEIYHARMINIFGSPLPMGQITAFLTTNNRCSYSLEKNIFFIFTLSEVSNRVIAHELFHFYTYYTFKEEFNKLDSVGDKKNAYLLKESMIEILDIECADLLEAPNKVYPGQEDLRILVRKLWLSRKDIRLVFQGIMPAIKKHSGI